MTQLDLGMKETGLSPSDSTFLRVLARSKQGNKFASSLMPYVIGDRLANFTGDLLKVGLPSHFIGNLWKNTKP